MPSWDEIKTAMIETWNEDDNSEAVIEAKQVQAAPELPIP